MTLKILRTLQIYFLLVISYSMIYAQNKSAKLLLKIEAADKDLFHKNAFFNDTMYPKRPIFYNIKEKIAAKDTNLVKTIIEKGTVFNFDLKSALKQTNQIARSIKYKDFYDLEADSLILNKCELNAMNLNESLEQILWDMYLDSTIDLSTNKEFKNLSRKQSTLHKKKCYKSFQNKVFTSAKWLVTFAPMLQYKNYVLVYYGYRKKAGGHFERVRILRFNPS